MKYIRKVVSVFLMAAVLLTMTIGTVSGQPIKIYETNSKQTITSGVTLENIVRFTYDGWLNINVLRVDLTNPYIKMDTLVDSESIRKLSTVKSLAQSKGAVAAVNGSFFSWSAQSGYGDFSGLAVESGNIMSLSSDFNRYGDSLATMSVNDLNEVFFKYWRADITLVAPNGNISPVGRYNKPVNGNHDFTVLDRKWGASSVGVSAAYTDIMEMVVDNGKVVEIRQNQPAVQIPVNGYVVVANNTTGQFLLNNFTPGDPVELDIKTTPDWQSMKMAVSGGAILLADGQMPQKFTHEVAGRHPRTAVGSTSDGKQLMLVTVDGRQNNSIGMTMQELAQLMKELGAYNAMNFDGGDSTTMVARTPGSNNIEVKNTLPGGYQRSISTAVGVFSIAPPGPLEGLIINTEDTNMFVNTSRAFSVKGYDRYFNPVEVKPEDVHWSVSGVQGSFSGNVFHPGTVGEGKIRATVGNATGELAISSLSTPVQLVLNEQSLKLSRGQSKTFTVTGKNKNGYHARINPEDVKWSLNGNIGSLNANVFTAAGQGTGYIGASVGTTHAYCTVSIASSTSTVKDNFEKENGTFLVYPDTVEGSYALSSKQKHSGSYSGKLTYNFIDTEGSRAAYMLYANGGLPLEQGYSRLGLWVYNDHPNTSWLRAEIYDSNGGKHMVDLSRTLDWTGWKYVEASLDGISMPAKLTRLYVVQTNPITDSGAVYFDDLAGVTPSSYPPVDLGKIPQDTQFLDEANKSTTYKKTEDSFRFAVFGQASQPKNPLEKLLFRQLSEKVNSYLDACALIGSGTRETAGTVKTPVVTAYEGYKYTDIKNSRFIQLDTGKLGLRASKPEQWGWFLDKLNSFKGSNVFIFLDNPPSSFSDNLEAKLFQDVLTKYKQESRKNVWVFYKGSKNGSYMEKGIKYITTAGFDAGGLKPDTTDLAKYILITVQESGVTFEFKPIVD
jgi:hypothetical protein